MLYEAVQFTVLAILLAEVDLTGELLDARLLFAHALHTAVLLEQWHQHKVLVLHSLLFDRLVFLLHLSELFLEESGLGYLHG